MQRFDTIPSIVDPELVLVLHSKSSCSASLVKFL
jgi:hypothetical protein